MDTLATHRSPKPTAILQDIGAWFGFLPPCARDTNLIEAVFARIKTLIPKAATRTCGPPWQAVGNLCNIFNDESRDNLFNAAGYTSDCPQHSLGPVEYQESHVA